jgi:hypothetical protein
MNESVRSPIINESDIGKDPGFEILAAVTTKSTIFWDVTPCSPAEVH